jgi:diacylglycerol kinase family enzyme
MGGIGIVNNPRAARNRRLPETGPRLARLLGDEGQVLDAETPEQLARALDGFRAAGVDTLGVNGGDGTCHMVLTAAAAIWGGTPLPRLLVLRGGTMNTLAANHGLRGTPEELLAAELTRRREGAAPLVVERDLLRVEADGRPPLMGFLFATGVAVAFLERFYAVAPRSPQRAFLVVAYAIGSALVGGSFARALTRREPLRIESDGDEWADQAYLTLLAGTVPSLGLGFRALARCDEQPGFFHAVGVHGSLARVVRSLPRVHRGAPWRRRAALDVVARSLTVEGDEAIRFMVDGDLQPAARTLRLSTGPGLQVLVMPPRRGKPAAAV